MRESRVQSIEGGGGGGGGKRREGLIVLQGAVECAPPNAEIYRFDSRMTMNANIRSSRPSDWITLSASSISLPSYLLPSPPLLSPPPPPSPLPSQHDLIPNNILYCKPLIFVTRPSSTAWSSTQVSLRGSEGVQREEEEEEEEEDSVTNFT